MSRYEEPRFESQYLVMGHHLDHSGPVLSSDPTCWSLVFPLEFFCWVWVES